MQPGHRHEALEDVAEVLGGLFVAGLGPQQAAEAGADVARRAEPLHGGQVRGNLLGEVAPVGQGVHAADGPHVRRAFEVADQVGQFLVVADGAAAAGAWAMAARMVASSPMAISPGSRKATIGRAPALCSLCSLTRTFGPSGASGRSTSTRAGSWCLVGSGRRTRMLPMVSTRPPWLVASASSRAWSNRPCGQDRGRPDGRRCRRRRGSASSRPGRSRCPARC